MDPSCSACSDFYQYANGGWLRRTQIPTGLSHYSTYDEVNSKVLADLDAIVAQGVRDAREGKTGDLAKIGIYYESCMDEAAADRAGIAPIADELRRLQALRSPNEVPAAIRRVKVMYPDLLFWANVDVDPMDPHEMLLSILQEGLSLDDAPLYFGSSKEAVDARSTLLGAATKMFELSGESGDAAKADAARVLALETDLAKVTAPPEDLRDRKANYHVMSLAQAQRLTPHWDWRAFAESLGIKPPQRIDLSQLRFAEGFDRALTEHSPADWSAYLRWNLLKTAAPWLSQPFRSASFAFTSHFSGAKAPRPRHRQCMDALNDGLGPLVGKYYEQRYFSPATRRAAERMVANLETAMAGRIEKARWMQPRTRREALKKLAAVRVYVGGPDKIPDYSAFIPVKAPFWGNVAAANAFGLRAYAARLDKPVDPAEWYHVPQDVSGGADFSRNSFQYPAAKFQPPFFDPNADPALNYGALGATMAHELTHLFDSNGRQYDSTGRMRDWWTERDAAAYQARADRLARQFSTYRVGGEQVNGKLTLAENIADLSGLTVAYDALERELAGKPRRKIGGFTEEQRFFLAWARNFREVDTPQWLHWQVRNDVHSPMKVRVNAPLSDMSEFDRAFGCRPGNAMYRPPAERVRIW